MAYSLEEISNKITKLPVLPEIVMRLLDLLQDENSTATQVEDLLEKEPGLAVQILKLVNSAFYGLPSPVGDIKKAIVILGFKEVKNIVVANSVGGAFKGVKLPPSFNITTFWRHSLVNGCVAKFMAARSGSLPPGDAFTLGLLHDIGKLLLAAYEPEALAKVMTLAENEAISFYDAEKQIMETNHCEIGGWLTEKWKLPEAISVSIRSHHDPDLFEKDLLAAGAHFGNYISSVKKMRCDGSFERMPLNGKVWGILGIKRDALREVLNSVNKEIQTAEAMMGAMAVD